MISILSEILGPADEGEFLEHFPAVQGELRRQDIITTPTSEIDLPLITPESVMVNIPRRFLLIGELVVLPDERESLRGSKYALLERARAAATAVEAAVAKHGWWARTRVFVPTAQASLTILPSPTPTKTCDMPKNPHPFNPSNGMKSCPSSGHIFSDDHNIDWCPYCGQRLH